MFSVYLKCARNEEDVLVASMWEFGTTGIIEEPDGLRFFFEDGRYLDPALAALSRQEPDTDWAKVARDSFPALNVGEKLFLAPEWSTEPTPEGRLRLTTNPGMACGTGYHPCTQMCLEALERYLRPGDSLLDVGCGSGILCRAGLLLGAGRVIGCDNDPDSVEVSRQELRAPLFVGSADAIRSNSFDVIVANISATAVEQLTCELWRSAKRPSILILSGFTKTERVRGFIPTEAFTKDEWVCLVVRPTHSPPA